MKLSIIIPIFNEEENIRNTIPLMLDKISRLFSEVELVAVNDGSTDATSAVLKQIGKKDKRIKIISHTKNSGYGAALRSGIQAASYEWVFFTDADMQFDVSELKKFIPNMQRADFIIGYRINRADPLRRKISSWFYNKAIDYLFGLKLRDVDCAFKLMKKSSVLNIQFYSNSFFVSAELMAKALKEKYRITEVPVQHFPRIKGHSTVTAKKILKSISDLFKLYIALS